MANLVDSGYGRATKLLDDQHRRGSVPGAASAYNRPMSSVFVVLCTFPNADEASNVAKTLVGEELVACINIVPGLRSIYRWQGEIHDASEVLAVIKTTEAGFPALEQRLAALHSYDCPEILALPVNQGHAPYIDWVLGNVSSTTT